MRKYYFAIIVAVLLFGTSFGFAENADTTLSVYKNQQCGCCGKWIEHLEDLGFQVNAHDMEVSELNEIKTQRGVAPQIRSCHTGVYQDKYVFEGHIPAKYISKFLLEQPEGAIGLTVPGMPVGSPGMEVGDKFSPYDILIIKEDGSHDVYAHVDSYEAQF